MAEPHLGCGRELLFHTLEFLNIVSEAIPYYPPPRPSNCSGIFCKNLFLKDRKSQYYLVILEESSSVDFKKLRSQVGAHRNFSFASADELSSKLKMLPGSVTPFALLNDPNCSVKVVIDARIANSTDPLNFHPMAAAETMLISYPELEKFFAHCGHEVTVVATN